MDLWLERRNVSRGRGTRIGKRGFFDPCRQGGGKSEVSI